MCYATLGTLDVKLVSLKKGAGATLVVLAPGDDDVSSRVAASARLISSRCVFRAAGRSPRDCDACRRRPRRRTFGVPTSAELHRVSSAELRVYNTQEAPIAQLGRAPL